MGDQKKQGNESKTSYIVFCAGIDEKPVQEFMDVIASKISGDTERLYILFSTGGGSVSCGFALYNFLRALPYDIEMHNIGSVDSIGIVIFLAAQKRYSTANGTFLIHRVKSEFKKEKMEGGSINEKLSCVKGEEKKISDVVISRSKMPVEEFNKLFEAGELKDAEYGLKNGIIEEIKDVSFPQGAQIFVIKA
jgi:ATP-dependent Clp protease, protease subunit